MSMQRLQDQHGDAVALKMVVMFSEMVVVVAKAVVMLSHYLQEGSE